MPDETIGSAPEAAPSEVTEQPAAVPTDAAGGEQPEAQGEQEKGGPLPQDVHPAVKEERERARRYRQMVERVFVLDDQGQPIGYNPEFLAQLESVVTGQYQQQQATAQDTYRRKLQEWAEAKGFIPEQVEAIMEIAEAIANRRVSEMTAPILEASIEQVKAGLIQSGVVPREAVSFVTRWIDVARKINPRALLTREGQETVIRQAIGEWYLQQMQGGGQGRPQGPQAPAQLRPTPGSSRPTPSPEEARIRAKLGLPVDKYGPIGPEE